MEDTISRREPGGPEEMVFHRELCLPAEEDQLSVLREIVSAIPGITDELKMTLHLVVEEIFINICSYSYPEGGGMVDVSFDAGDRVTMVFRDSGRPFDPTKDIPDMEKYDIMTQVGGVGRFLTFQLVDEYSYEYRDGKNVLRLVKYAGE